MPIHFLQFELDPTTGLLHGPEGEVRLRPKTLALLQVLVKRAPGVVEKDELVDVVWGQEHLGPSSLAQAVSELRAALGDDPREPRIIETVHRRGYRFIAAVEAPVEAPEEAPEEASERAAVEARAGALAERPMEKEPAEGLPPGAPPAKPGGGFRWRVVAWGLTAGVLLFLATLLWGPEGDSGPPAQASGTGIFERPQRIALMPFETQELGPGAVPSELAWLDLGLRGMLAQRLDRHPQLYLYPLRRVQAMQRDLPEMVGFGDRQPAGAERYLGAHWLLQGEWSSPAAGKLRYRLWLRRTTPVRPPGAGSTGQEGEGESMADEEGTLVLEDEVSLEDLPHLVHRWARRIAREVVGAPRRERPRSPMFRHGLPVIRQYFVAFEQMEEQPLEALRLFEELGEEMPSAVPVARARIALLDRLGRREEARKVAARSLLMADDPLDRVFFLVVQGHVDEARVVVRKMSARQRQDPESWLEWLSWIESNAPSEQALAWLAEIPPATRGRWLAAELALIETRAAAREGDRSRARHAAERAQRVGRQQGHGAAVAEADAFLAALHAEPRVQGEAPAPGS